MMTTERLRAAIDKWKGARLVMKSEDLEFKTRETGTTAQVVNANLGFPNSQLSSFIREIPPGWKSGNHTHNFEAIIRILEGKGYSMVDGDKHEWKADDVITIPPMAAHQHFNTDQNQRVRFFAVITSPLMQNLGALNGEALGNAGPIE